MWPIFLYNKFVNPLNSDDTLAIFSNIKNTTISMAPILFRN